MTGLAAAVACPRASVLPSTTAIDALGPKEIVVPAIVSWPPGVRVCPLMTKSEAELAV